MKLTYKGYNTVNKFVAPARKGASWNQRGRESFLGTAGCELPFLIPPVVVLRTLNTVEPIVGVAFRVGDCEHAEFCGQFKKDQCVGKPRELCTPNLEISRTMCQPWE